jgi:hypothetical protein
VEQGAGGVSIGYAAGINRSLAESAPMNQEFNHAANDSPRSGSSKQVTPVVWAAIVVAMIAIAIWFAMRV